MASNSSNKEKDLLYFGSVIKPRGLKGSLKIASSLTEGFPIEPFEIFLSKQGKFIPFMVSSIKFEPNDTILNLEGIHDLDAAIPLTGHDVYIDSQKLKLKKAPFSYSDLEGYFLIDQDLGPIGDLERVLELPQQWIGVIEEKGIEILIPLNDDLIVTIDKKNKKLICSLPEGLLDIYRNP